PEVDRGALGAATHLSRLVPQHMMRAMYYTGQTVTAQRLAELGAVHSVVPRADLGHAALALADATASEDPPVLRLAKEALTGIDRADVNHNSRFEQGFTFELNRAGVADERRDEFVARSGTSEG